MQYLLSLSPSSQVTFLFLFLFCFVFPHNDFLLFFLNPLSFFPFFKNGATPLFIASHLGHIEVVKLLISSKANLDAPCLRGGIYGSFLKKALKKEVKAARQEIQRLLSEK